jgi:translation initiation factor 2 beta subunit (eIF-2beta)/eIF-5
MTDGMVWLAESMSYRTCETCGSTNNVTQTEGWIYTRCEKCIKQK